MAGDTRFLEAVSRGDMADGRPKYMILAEKMTARIRSGKFPVGTQLPPERDLCQAFTVANHTLRRALSMLEREGLIRREQGRGTFVADISATSTASLGAGRWTPGLQPAILIGLGPSFERWHDPSHWEVRLRRYSGVVEGGFHFGIPVMSRRLDYTTSNDESLVSHLHDTPGLILDYDTDGPPPLPDTVVSRLRLEGVPIVGIGRHIEPVCSEIRIDIAVGAAAVLEHLIGLGHKRIACIGGGNNVYTQIRERAYRDVLERNGLGFDPALVIRHPQALPDDAVRCMRSLLDLPQRPTAIFCANDLRAFGAIEAIQQTGLRVPEDIAVAGYDDADPAKQFNPPLTTVYNPLYEEGFEAVRMLKEIQQSRESDIRIRTLAPRLVIRRSCGAKQ